MKNYFYLILIIVCLFISCLLTFQNIVAQTNEQVLDTSSLDESLNGGEPANQENLAVPTDSQISKTDFNDPGSSENESVESSEGASDNAGNQTSIWGLILASGWVGFIIVALSIYACSLVIQFLLVLRRPLLLPEELLKRICPLMEQGNVRSAFDYCVNDSSMLGRVLVRGLKEFNGSWNDMEKALEDAIADETAILYRKVESLSVIGNIAPMLGLLGTVMGMVMAFGDLAASDGLARNLAQGIYFALMTTVEGLLVAIPALAAFAFFNNRVAALSSELSQQVEDIFRPIKKRMTVSRYSKETGQVNSSQPIPSQTNSSPSSPSSSFSASLPQKNSSIKGLEEIVEKESNFNRTIPSLKPKK